MFWGNNIICLEHEISLQLNGLIIVWRFQNKYDKTSFKPPTYLCNFLIQMQIMTLTKAKLPIQSLSISLTNSPRNRDFEGILHAHPDQSVIKA